MLKLQLGGSVKRWALLDAADYRDLRKYNWHYNNGYAYNHTLGYLHRYLLPTQKPLEVDHINRNRLDNRRANLRAVSRAQNMVNRSPWVPDGKAGVRWRGDRGKWQVLLSIPQTRRQVFFGLWNTEEAAAEVALVARQALRNLSISGKIDTEPSQTKERA